MRGVVYSQLVYFTDSNNIFTNYQSGFRKGYSCEYGFQFVLNDWQLTKDVGKTVILTFLDLRRAFETGDIIVLLYKLRGYAISGYKTT